MEEGKRHFRLGLFVVVTVAALAGVLFLLGGRKLFQQTFTFETYFNESVAGLDLGAPVRFRGVPLGQVTQILTSNATYEKNVPLGQRKNYIVVRAKVNASANEAGQMEQDMGELVKKGLRAQTQFAGITGQQYLAIDFFDPAQFPALDFPWTPDYDYLPSARSLTRAIIANGQEFLASLNDADVKTLGQNLNALVVDLKNKVDEAPVAEVVKNANATIERIDQIVAAAPIERTLRRIDAASTRLEGLLGDPRLKQTIDNVAAVSARARHLVDDSELDSVVKRINNTVERLDVLVGDNQYDLGVIVQDLRMTADNLRALSEMVKRYPAGALIGGPPEPVELPGKSR